MLIPHTADQHPAAFFLLGGPCPLDLSVRAMNCLNTANIKLLGELCLKNESRMLKYRNFGKKSLDEIKEKLAAHSLQLAMPLSENLTNAILAEAERVKATKTKEEE